MNKGAKINYEEEQFFALFLQQLRQQDAAAWEWLLDHFREKVVPYIRKRDGRLAKDTIVSEAYFIEEVFANSLIKFYELFVDGQFENLGQLRSMMFRISEIKLKEGYRQVKKDKTLFFTTPSQTDKDKQQENNITLSQEEQAQQQVILKMEKVIHELPQIDREILLRFAKGEKLKSIANDLNVNVVNCRKKKQRALQKMRQLLNNIR